MKRYLPVLLLAIAIATLGGLSQATNTVTIPPPVVDSHKADDNSKDLPIMVETPINISAKLAEAAIIHEEARAQLVLAGVIVTETPPTSLDSAVAATTDKVPEL